MPDPRAKVDALRERIETSEELSDADRETLLAFSDEMALRQRQLGDHRHAKLLRHCTRMAEHVGGLTDALEKRGAAEDLVRWIHREYDNEETNRDYRLALRALGRFTTDVNGDDPPECLAWIPSSTSSNYDPAPDPSEMLHWDGDVQPMIEATENTRDAALIAVAWDAGPRSGEIRSLSYGDVNDHRHGLQITVDGKTGQRSITLIPSVPYLQRWLEDHPGGDRDDPLWSKLITPESMSYRMFVKILESAAERAGVDKPVTFTNFRKSSASYLASQGMNQAHIEDHHGWKRGSEVAARYVSIFGEDADRELAKVHGAEIDETEESDPVAPIECPRCGRETPRDEEFCMWCHQALGQEAIQTTREREKDLREAVMRLIRKDPDLLDDIERVQDAMTVLEERPDLHADAEAFRDALRES